MNKEPIKYEYKIECIRGGFFPFRRRVNSEWKLISREKCRSFEEAEQEILDDDLSNNKNYVVYTTPQEIKLRNPEKHI